MITKDLAVDVEYICDHPTARADHVDDIISPLPHQQRASTHGVACYNDTTVMSDDSIWGYV